VFPEGQTATDRALPIGLNRTYDDRDGPHWRRMCFIPTPMGPWLAREKDQGVAMSRTTTIRREVSVASTWAALDGVLTLPGPAAGVVLFAHGSGSSRRSRRNGYVDRWARPLIDWRYRLGRPPTGAERAADRTARCQHRLSCGLVAPSALPLVACPTCCLVDGQDFEVLQLNRQAAAQLTVTHALQVVPGVGQLFEEPGAPEQAAHLARDWFLQHLAGARTATLS
jgi:hypothetical protein